jgi:hypothetical protein
VGKVVVVEGGREVFVVENDTQVFAALLHAVIKIIAIIIKTDFFKDSSAVM